MFNYRLADLVVGQATVVIDDIYGHRETVCPMVAAGEWARQILKRTWKWLLRRVGYYSAIIALAGALSNARGYVGPEHLPFIMSAITTAAATSFKVEQGVGTHNFTITTGDVVKWALYTSAATLGAGTTAYSATNELAGTGYTAGGVTTANATPVSSGTTCIYDWVDPSWSSATWTTANGTLAYNSSKSNKAILVVAFGSDQSVTAGTFTIQLPVADASNAILRY